MVKPLSNDLRKRVVAAVVKGESSRAVASRFGVAVSSVVKWSQRYRATGSVKPGQMGGHRKRRLSGEIATWLERRLSGGPFTLKGLVEELGERGVATGVRAVWVFVHDHKLSFKKNRARQRADAPGEEHELLMR